MLDRFLDSQQYIGNIQKLPRDVNEIFADLYNAIIEIREIVIPNVEGSIPTLPPAALTSEGGVVITLTNKTGATTIKGTIVSASTTFDNAFEISLADSVNPIGVVYSDGIADGAECQIVIYGRAQVLLEDSTTGTRGYWCKVSDTVAGRADATNSSSPSGTLVAIDDHLSEIGHCLENVIAGTDVLCYMMIHFN